jgi:hypothetical protein
MIQYLTPVHHLYEKKDSLTYCTNDSEEPSIRMYYNICRLRLVLTYCVLYYCRPYTSYYSSVVLYEMRDILY